MTLHEKNRFVPDGPIKSQLPFESQLAADYYQFLMKLDPLHLWTDIQPLTSPIETQSKFELDQQQVAKISSIFPSLPSELAEAERWGGIAAALGFRYAWTRVHMHMKALTHIEPVLGDLTAIVEPGVGGGGIIHFLPTQTNLTYYGIDCSPQALDVCRYLEQSNQLKGTRKLSRANFYALHTNHLTQFNIDPRKTLIFFSNFLSNGNSIWQAFPCIEPIIVAAWLVSYWVNAGATVLLCERCDDGESFVRFIVENGKWNQDSKANLLDEFESYSTYESSVENPVGEWRKSKCVIASFQG